jgi:hypothetical protein
LVRLELGQIGHVADVRVNGHSLGVVWASPWTADLTSVANAGRNQLEIDIINVWVNRLIGDAGLEPEKRFTRSNVRLFRQTDQFRPFQGFSPKDPLEPSGLLGPVRITFGQEREVEL